MVYQIRSENILTKIQVSIVEKQDLTYLMDVMMTKIQQKICRIIISTAN